MIWREPDRVLFRRAFTLLLVALLGCTPRAEDSRVKAAEALLARLNAPRFEERRRAESELTAMGTNAVPLLLTALERTGEMLESHTQAGVQNAGSRRVTLLRAFKLLGTNLTPFASQLKAALASGKEPVTAAYALAQLDEDHAAYIIEVLKQGSPKARLAAAGAVSEIRSPGLRTNAVPPLLLLLEDSSPQTRAVGATLLGHLRMLPEQSLPRLLMRVQQDPDWLVRGAAAGAIARFGTNASLIQEDIERVISSRGDSKETEVLRNVLERLKQPPK